MANLMPLARGYLESAGFNILRQEGDLLVADKVVFGQDRSTWIVWTVPTGLDLSASEAALLPGIRKAKQNYPDAKAYVLTATRGGFSRDTLQALTAAGVTLLVPVQFFDAPFKHEDARQAATAITALKALASNQKRVPQPYTGEGDEKGGEDLFKALGTELSQSQRPLVRVVVGRAGIGKSCLFRALFSQLYDGFQEAKGQMKSSRPRPIPLLPEHLKGTYALRTEALIENFLRTDIASPVKRETFEWLLVNGYATWLLDGLDELYAGDPDFFEYLLDLVTREDSKAQITIWCRDSLLTTLDAFADFRQYAAGTGFLKTYQLSQWERPSKRAFAWLGLEERSPNQGERDTEPVASFLKEIDRTPALQALSKLPFYCDLLLQQFREGRINDFDDEVSMLNHIVDQMVERETKKGLLDLQLFEQNGLQEWLEEMAASYVEGQRYADISRDDALSYGELVLRGGIDKNTRDHVLTSLVQFPLFRAGSDKGLIGFTHDLIAEALAARAYLRALTREPADVGTRLSRIDLEDPSLLRFMAARFGTEQESKVTEELQRGVVQGRSFAVLASLLMLARPDRDLLKRGKFLFEARDLTAVRFVKRDLSGVSFRQADLSHAVFTDCDLSNAQFEGAFFHRTRFEGNNQLRGSQFGDLGRVQSVFVGKKLIEDLPHLRKWVSEVTGAPEAVGEPCDTALQILHMFSKFVTPLGEARRHDLKHSALLAGRKYGGAPSIESCIEAVVHQGFLVGPDYRKRFRRPDGDKYSEMVRFVRDGSVSDTLGGLLRRLCPRRGCLHQLRG